MFGLTNHEGNHGEDVKELYYYLDATPTHSYLRGLYRYPQKAFPYTQLIQENQRRGRDQPEFEILDTGVFNDCRYFDIYAEYAKASDNDILIRITVCNRAAQEAILASSAYAVVSQHVDLGLSPRGGLPDQTHHRKDRRFHSAGRARDAGPVRLRASARPGRIPAAGAVHGE